MDRIKICALGGLDENGRDCYIVEINDDMFVVDAGSLVPDKNMPGIDVVLPNATYIIENKNRLKAYIITHGHDENMSALKYFYFKAPAPIYCTFSTSQVAKGQAAIHHKEINNANIVLVNPNDTVEIAGHTIELFQTFHNAANSFGVCFKTDRGNIIYSSDYIIDFSMTDQQYQFGFDKLYKIAKNPTLLLMSESKTANKEGYCSPRHRLLDKMRKHFEEPKRIYVSCFWQNAYRIMEIFKLIKETNRKVYFYDEYTRVVMNQLINSDIGIHIKDEDIVSKEDFVRIPKQQMVILIVGQSYNIYDEIRYICEGINPDSRIKINPDDIFINGASPSVSQEAKATDCLDSLYRTGCKVVWFDSKSVAPMHAYQDDIKVLLTTLRPMYYLPVRGTYSKMMDNAKIALSMNIGLNHMNVFILDNGMQLCFDDKSPRPIIIPNEVNKIDLTPMLVDGTGVSDYSSQIVDERQKLSVDGAVVIAATVSKSKKAIVAGPDCQMRGFVFLKEAEPLLKSITQIFLDEINTAISQNDFTFENAKEQIIERSSKFIKRDNGREPLITPIVVVLD
ncbi:MAG: ribonuclease J [Bacilli bacterium]|nr:ribonuclease J [Bacilli bacterium]